MVSLRWCRMSREQKQAARLKRLRPINVYPLLPAGRVKLPADDYFTGPAA